MLFLVHIASYQFKDIAIFKRTHRISREREGGEVFHSRIHSNIEFLLQFFLLLAVHCGDATENRFMLEPFVTELKDTLTDPVAFEVMSDNGTVTTKKLQIFLLCSICDGPARSKLLHLKSCTSQLGCCNCVSETLKPIPEQLKKGIEYRENKQWRDLAKEREAQTKVPKKDEYSKFLGIAGETPIMELEYVDMSFFCFPEIMHSMFLGVTKWIIDSFFASKSQKERELGCKMVNTHLTKLAFPSCVGRTMPNNILEQNLKSVDYENLLLYGFIAFKNVMSAQQYECFERFSYLISR